MDSCRSILVLLLLGLTWPCHAEEPRWPAEKREHWAWKPAVRPGVPEVGDKAWIRNPIDAFIMASLEAAHLRPALPASREQLLRRVTFDLTGLPPTPSEIDAFVQDPSAEAWESVLDRLLASPHYGERWARHWLDLARFADSNGFEFDEVRPDAWRYRDYVIEAFNADKPYDRFILEQLAGDTIDPDQPQALIATGFNLLGSDMTDAASQIQRRQHTLDDMTDTASLAFLGLTVGCARCHHHKFEPISIQDYYRFQAFFAPAQFRKDLPVADREQRANFAKQLAAYGERIQPTKRALEKVEEPYRLRLQQDRIAKLADAARQAHLTPAKARTDSQKDLVESTLRFLVISTKDLNDALNAEDRFRQGQLTQELKKLESQKPRPLAQAMGLQDQAKAPKTFVLKRGELHNHGEEVEPAWPTILNVTSLQAPDTTASRRGELARWIASPENPLTLRVIVNRLWQHHFGRGIVPTPSDFGLRGDRPTHPELIDWLACEFVEQGWSLKKLHKLMLMSATYQQSTLGDPQTMNQDPTNRLFGRMNRLRLEAEVVRDSLLEVSGRLHRKAGGPGVFPPAPTLSSTVAKDWIVSPDPRDHVRRSVYLFVRRNLRFPFLDAFDLPDNNASCPERQRSVTAPQALTLLNAHEVTEAAKGLAARIQAETMSQDERVTQAYRLSLGRAPSESERAQIRDFLQESPLSELCRVLLNLNEFLYLD